MLQRMVGQNDEGNGSYNMGWMEEEEEIMVYLFKAKKTIPVKIEANNIEQAKRFFLNDHVIINKMKGCEKRKWKNIEEKDHPHQQARPA